MGEIVTDDEINPEHPVTAGLRGQWHMLCGVLLLRLGIRLGKGEVLITAADIEAFSKECPPGSWILAHEQADGLRLRMVTASEAPYLARKEAGHA